MPEALVLQRQSLAPLLQAQPPQFWQRTRRHLLLAPAKQQLLALQPQPGRGQLYGLGLGELQAQPIL